MSCFNESFAINKAENLVEMRGTRNPLVKAVTLSCGSCEMLYTEYKQLLAHLYWRHGTESAWCKNCGLKRWRYAPHVCHVLPINDGDVDECSSNSYYVKERESDFCFCGRHVEGSAMIGCDGPRCPRQWYHFRCVGIVSPPDGDWFCPECVQNKAKLQTKVFYLKFFFGLANWY